MLKMIFYFIFYHVILALKGGNPISTGVEGKKVYKVIQPFVEPLVSKSKKCF